MKKILRKEVIIAFIIGIIIASGIVYAATSAREVTYTTNKNGEVQNVADALNDLYSKSSNKIVDISTDNISIEQQQSIDNTVSKTYTAIEDEIIVICVSETGDSRYTNTINTTGIILYDSTDLNTKAFGPEINRDWYINIRTVTIKLTKDDTVTISSYGQCYGSGQYSITHIK